MKKLLIVLVALLAGAVVRYLVTPSVEPDANQVWQYYQSITEWRQ